MSDELIQRSHVFGLDEKQPGENRTLLIVVVTAIMMVVEIIAGIAYGSMALLADGLHMGSHAVALGISVLAYVVSRKFADDTRLSFGIGKLNSLAGFSSAVLLMGFALLMIVESVGRYFNPQTIAFDQALLVAVIGLVVNGGSAALLVTTPHGHNHSHNHNHNHNHSHSHEHSHSHDHNLRAAYLHVLADAVTSFLAIGALLAAKYYDATWLDPAMGIVGGVLVARWSFSLIRETAGVLMDYQADERRLSMVRECIVAGSSDSITDLHLWRIGPGLWALALEIESSESMSPADYRERIPDELDVVHATISVTHR